VTKIYTKGGDKGQTGLFNGERVSKAHPLVNAYGTVDELNSSIGLARALHGMDDKLGGMLDAIQNELLMAGADLASGAPEAAKRINDAQVERFEKWIDEMTAEMTPLSNFIVPGGHPAAAALHVSRTVGRRAERMIVEAGQGVEIDSVVVRYFNRLADLLFVLARYANHVHGQDDVVWRNG
jgi:cob(I)alamin adenosyltransferase